MNLLVYVELPWNWWLKAPSRSSRPRLAAQWHRCCLWVTTARCRSSEGHIGRKTSKDMISYWRCNGFPSLHTLTRPQTNRRQEQIIQRTFGQFHNQPSSCRIIEVSRSFECWPLEKWHKSQNKAWGEILSTDGMISGREEEGSVIWSLL